MQDDTQGDGPERSPISEVYQELQALRPQWYAEIGEPRGTGWIRGTAFQTASTGPFQTRRGWLAGGKTAITNNR